MRLDTILQLYVARAAGVAAGLAQATGTATPSQADAVAGGILGLANDHAEERVSWRGDRGRLRQAVQRVLALQGEALEDREDPTRLLALLPGPTHGRLAPAVVEVVLEPADGSVAGLRVAAVAKRLPAGGNQAQSVARAVALALTEALGTG